MYCLRMERSWRNEHGAQTEKLNSVPRVQWAGVVWSRCGCWEKAWRYLLATHASVRSDGAQER